MACTGSQLRAKRAAHGISGAAVASKVGTSRSRLSEIECNYLKPSAEELARISLAIDEIIRERQQLAKLAADAGLSLAGIRL
jgi:transcriptional regulator with XRE-family HTH domain